MTQPNVEKKSYKYIIRLKNAETYLTKNGEEKTFDTYFVTEYSQSDILSNAISMIISREDGKTRKISISKDEIKSIEEIVE